MRVKVKKLVPEAKLPVYATDGSGCFDIHTNQYENWAVDLDKQGHTHTFGTGLAFEIPKGYCMLIFSRSGHGFNSDTRLANCVGVIDSDYRGELFVKLTRDIDLQWDTDDLCIKHGDRIAQGMIIPVPKIEFELTDELSDTARGTGGLGH
jgi:dUTP pyrophosphatase